MAYANRSSDPAVDVLVVHRHRDVAGVLMSAFHRTGTSKAGPVTARLVPCSKSKWHRHHPENELCGECDPPVVDHFKAWSDYVAPVLPADWYVSVHTGDIYDLNIWPQYKTNGNFLPLDQVLPFTVEAKRLCGCYTGPCSYWQDAAGYKHTAHSWPLLVKYPGVRAP